MPTLSNSFDCFTQQYHIKEYVGNKCANLMEDQKKKDAFSLVASSMPEVCKQINKFSSEVLRTRGGRVGSGMGGLLEALWGYHTNIVIAAGKKKSCELAWFPDHQFNDFACVIPNKDWNPATKEGELFRIEAKSMNFGAAESKAHFDVLEHELDRFDALLLLVWRWSPLDVDGNHCCPQIVDSFFGLASSIVRLRDTLHLTRGGTFVDKQSCPDKCPAHKCSHHGEPLNEKGSRERLTGPQSCRPSSNVPYAANFGGLVRMLKTSSMEAKQAFRKIRRTDEVADKYINFIHRNYPTEEQHHYSAKEWRDIATELGINDVNRRVPDLCSEIRTRDDYTKLLRNLT